MVDTKCYASVRGSAIRVTGLSARGTVPDPVHYAVSKSVAKVTINEVTESGSSEALGSEQNDNDIRLRLLRSDETVHYTVDIDFLRVDPGVLSLVAGVPLVQRGTGLGFGGDAFGVDPFGGPAGGGSTDGEGFGVEGFGMGPFGVEGFAGVDDDPPPDPDPEPVPEIEDVIKGFDSTTRLLPVSFGLEVWSKLAGSGCEPRVSAGFDTLGFDEGPFGGESTPRQYGYTLFPHLRGGRLSGFKFDNGLVSFNVRGAQTRRAPRWGVGPHDLEGPFRRLVKPVSRNTLFRQTLTVAPPPMEDCGIQGMTDVLEGWTATVTTEDIVDGGTAASTSAWIVEGGMAV